MTNEPAPHRSVPFGTLLVLAIACVLYVTMLANISFSAGGGDASVGRAIASLLFTLGTWIALAVLLAVGGIMGDMPRWAAWVAVILLPLSGVAAITAIDMCSRHHKWAVIFPVLLPLLIATYALWARVPRFHAAISAERMSACVWILVLVLSIAALLAASII
jgi:hypothetical protein